MTHRTPWKLALACLGVGFGLTLAAARAGADDEPTDEITVKGMTLRGRVVNLGAETVSFQTIYGEGTLEIPYGAVERLETRGAYRVFTVDDRPIVGRLLGVEDGEVLVGEDRASAERVEVAEIQSAVDEPAYEASAMRRLRAALRNWNAEVDLGLNFEEGAVDEQKLNVGAQVERRLENTRFAVSLRYALEIQQKRNLPEQTTKNEFKSVILGEYGLTERVFAFGLVGTEWDEPRQVNVRTFPTAGGGYRLVLGERYELDASAGFGYVYEDFDGFGANDYAAGYLGLAGAVHFARGIRLRGRVGYWPGLSDPSGNWLFRSELDLTVPIWDPLALKAKITNVNDNNPARGIGNNKFETLFGLALRF